MQAWTPDTEIEDAMPPLVVLATEWEQWLTETELAVTDDELEDMANRETN